MCLVSHSGKVLLSSHFRVSRSNPSPLHGLLLKEEMTPCRLLVDALFWKWPCCLAHRRLGGILWLRHRECSGANATTSTRRGLRREIRTAIAFSCGLAVR